MPPLRAPRACLLACLLGAVAACGFAPLELWPLTILCLAGLVALVEGARRPATAAAIGWCFGLGHFCVGLNWIATAFTYQAAMPAWLGWVAVILLSLYLAVYPALATGVAWVLARRRRKGRALPLMLAATWIVGEMLRATVFTGFAWNPIAAIWAPLPPIAKLTALVGTYGLSGLTMLLAGAVRQAVRSRAAVIGVAITILAGGAAGLLMPGKTPDDRNAPMLHVVQPNIGQEKKWDEGQGAENFRRLATLSGRPGARARIVLWPEVAIPQILETDELARMTLAGLLGPQDILLTGGETLRFTPEGDLAFAANSLFALDARGRILGRYDKAHLVPYGEYLPMRPILSRIGLSRLAPGDADFNAGPGARDIVLPGIGPVGGQICYEIIFSGHVVDRAHRPRFLFNPSNDAWFGRWGPPQHLAQARLRAAEEGMPIVRSTPTGISAVIDADGRLLDALPWRTAGSIERALPRVHAPTPFARWGNILPLVLAFFLGALGFASARRRS